MRWACGHPTKGIKLKNFKISDIFKRLVEKNCKIDSTAC